MRSSVESVEEDEVLMMGRHARPRSIIKVRGASLRQTIVRAFDRLQYVLLASCMQVALGAPQRLLRARLEHNLVFCQQSGAIIRWHSHLFDTHSDIPIPEPTDCWVRVGSWSSSLKYRSTSYPLAHQAGGDQASGPCRTGAGGDEIR